MDTILRSKVPVWTYVDGFAASAATFMSVVGDHRFMSRNSYMLVHQLSTSFWGTYANFEDEKQNVDMMKKKIKKDYKEYTLRSIENLKDI